MKQRRLLIQKFNSMIFGYLVKLLSNYKIKQTRVKAKKTILTKNLTQHS